MPRKVFMSFLGTGIYEECVYYKGEKKCASTRFIQCATLEAIGAKEEWTGEETEKNWTEKDRVLIFVTDFAKKSNWDKTIKERYNPKEKKKVPYRGLQEELERMKLRAVVEDVHVDDGKDEDEMWKIFQDVYDKLEDGDELYVDLTHAFRYLPMLVVVLCNYAKLLKGIKVKHLSYGNYEARESNKAPIVSLLPLTKLQDWTSAATEFIRHGYADSLKGIITKELIPLLSDNATRTENVVDVNTLGAKLDSYVQERIFCRGMDISRGSGAMKLRKQLDKIENTSIEKKSMEPLNPIFTLLKDTTKVQDDIPMRCCEAARWCYERQLYQQAITLLQEGVNTFFCLRHGIRIDDEDKRDNVGAAFKMMDNVYSGKATLDSCLVETAVVNPLRHSLLQDPLLQDRDVVNKYTDLSGTRNDYNHSGFRSKRQPLSPSRIKEKIDAALDFFHQIFADNPVNADSMPAAPAKDKKDKEKVFVNLSNHPLSTWDKAQLRAAAQYGKPLDMPFPQIPADATSDDIKALALSTLRQICEAHGGKDVTVLCDSDITVHIMGEMTFTYAMVRLLKDCGVRCVASCTERVAEDLGDGDKVSHFHFVRFREY